MSEKTVAAGRRRTEAFRNLDDTLKIGGVISLKSCSYLLVGFALLHVFHTMVPILDWISGGLGFLLEIGITVILGVGLVTIERQEDEHFVAGLLRYYLSMPWRTLYSGTQRPAQAPPSIRRIIERYGRA